MKQYILTGIAMLALMVGCNTKADDGVGEMPKDNTDEILYFQFTKDGGTHSISVEERQEKTLTIEGISSPFEATEASNAGISLSKTTDPATVTVRGLKAQADPYPVTIKGTDTNGVSKTVTLLVTVTERDTGWKNGVYTVENIDGDFTEANSTGYVEFESLGYNTFGNDILPAAVKDRIKVDISNGMIRVTAIQHYDESTPITFSVKNAAGDTRKVQIKRVTKFWSTSPYGETVLAMFSSDINITKNSFDQLSAPPKARYKNTSIDLLHSGLDQKGKITKIDLNNITEVGFSRNSPSNTGGLSQCVNLKEIIANKVETIAYTAFANTALTSISLPAIKQIYHGANGFVGTFSGSPITKITLGKGLTRIDRYALTGIEGTLLELRIESSNPSAVTLDSGFIGETQAVLSVPSGSLNAWKSRYPWLETKFKGGVKGY